jgi:hypothetical protein
MSKLAVRFSLPCIAAALCLVPSGTLAQIHKCIDSGGKLSYQEQPCAGAVPEAGPASASKTAPASRASPSAPRPEPEYTKFRPAGPLDQSTICAFSGLALPADFYVYAAGGYAGRKLDFQIDQSGHAATQIDVAVNQAAKPVVLILGAYEPTIWNIGWTPKTRILAVLVTGYHRQAIAGLDAAVPTLNSSYDNKGACGYLYKVDGDDRLNPLARKLFGRPVDLAYPVPGGTVIIGERIDNPSNLVTSSARTPESYRDRNAPKAGEAGLEEAVRKGQLRRAVPADAQAWADAKAGGKRDVPPVAGGSPVRPPSLPHNAYVVLKAFEFPAGLYGAHSAIFYVPKGVPRPSGQPGHSSVYDFNTIDCRGPSCGAR